MAHAPRRQGGQHHQHGDTSVFAPLPTHMARPPGKTQLTIDELLKAHTPSGYSEDSGLDALGQMLGSAVASVTGMGRGSLERHDRARREIEKRSKHIPVRVPEWVHAQLSEEQKAAVDLVSKGESFVLLGKAGTGKTFTLVEAILAGLQRAGVGVLKSASTGRAATALGGSTIHSLTGVGLLHDKSVSTIIKSVGRRPKLRETWRNARVLVVDEFTMLSEDDMSKIETVARVARKGRHSQEMFGGLAVILCGDPCQLQCVSDEKNRSTPLFMSSLLSEIAPSVVYLQKVYRQTDAAFCNMLEDVRKGRVTPRVRAVLDGRLHAALPESFRNAAVHIYARRVDVAQRNEDVLRSLGGQTRRYRARVEVRVNTYRQERLHHCGRDQREDADASGEAVEEYRELVSSDVVAPGTKEYDRVLLANDGVAADGRRGDLPAELRDCDVELLDARDAEAVKLAAKITSDGQFAQRLELKVGAHVMLVRNISKMIRWGFVNGLTGTVVGFTRRKTQQQDAKACPPAPRGTVLHREKGDGKRRKLVALGPEEIVAPRAAEGGDSAASVALHDLTADLEQDYAVAIGVHPWQADATCERFVRRDDGDGDGNANANVNANGDGDGDGDGDGAAVDGWPVVEFAHVGRYVCKPMDYEFALRKISRNENAFLYAVQIPIVLCTAMTVHKVQGMTLPAAVVHLDSTMCQNNQAYVALSRVRSEHGLVLSSLDYGAIRADQRAVSFMDSVQANVDARGVARTRDVIHRCRVLVERGDQDEDVPLVMRRGGTAQPLRATRTDAASGTPKVQRAFANSFDQFKRKKDLADARDGGDDRPARNAKRDRTVQVSKDAAEAPRGFIIGDVSKLRKLVVPH